MESVPEEKKDVPNDDGSHKESGDNGGEVFSTIELIEVIGVVVFESVGIALHEAEFHFFGFIFDFFALWCGISVVNHRLQNSKFKRFVYLYWPAVCCAFVLFAFLGWSVSIKNSKQSTDEPHFKFSMCLASAPENMVYLTNDFLRTSNFIGETSKPNNLNSVLFFQRQSEQSICALRLFIENDSLVDADNPEVTVSVDGNWKCMPDSAWRQVVAEDYTVTKYSTGKFTTNKFQIWGYSLPSKELLSGNGEELPLIQISQPLNPSGFSLMVRAKKSPAIAIGLQIYFPTNFPFVINKPFLILGTNEGNGNGAIMISSEKFNELGRQGIISRK
jgi:hypothetical protein